MKKAIVAALILISTLSILAIIVTQSQPGHSTPNLKKFNSYEELRNFIEGPKRTQQQRNPYANFQFWNPNYWSSFLSRDSLYLNTAEPQFFTNDAQIFAAYPDYSGTNVQVEGVDEADIVKTDGEYIYVVANEQIVIVRAYPPQEAAVLSRIDVDGTLRQMFINKDRLVIFSEKGYWPAETFINIYDVSHRRSPEFKTQMSVEGSYFTSRMIGDYVYAVARKEATVSGMVVNLPTISYGNETKVVPANEIYYSDVVDYGYVFTTVISFNVEQDGQQPKNQTVLSGYTASIYASADNVYLAMTHDGNTILHRLHVESGDIFYVADGEVPGTVINQFAMDEYEGYFRICTTSWSSSTNVYILNMDLNITGRLEGIAPGETMHSARFMGSRAYLVTFRKIDPFFVVSLANTSSPAMLGELKVSGYSDYLHPYDENHVIGVGKETVPSNDDRFSWYQGVKISFFDVTNVSAPIELAKYEIGDRGTDSPLLTDHKAFLFDKEKNLLALPVSVALINESQYPYGVPSSTFGQMVWQGVYVFQISLATEEKMNLRGTITHLVNCNVSDYSRYVSRVLYIGDVLYTVSTAQVKMNFLADLTEIGVVNLNL